MLQLITQERAKDTADKQTNRTQCEKSASAAQYRSRTLRAETRHSVSDVPRRVGIEQASVWQMHHVPPLTILWIKKLENLPAVPVPAHRTI